MSLTMCELNGLKVTSTGVENGLMPGRAGVSEPIGCCRGHSSAIRGSDCRGVGNWSMAFIFNRISEFST